jgi:hypothetical protein
MDKLLRAPWRSGFVDLVRWSAFTSGTSVMPPSRHVTLSLSPWFVAPEVRGSVRPPTLEASLLGAGCCARSPAEANTHHVRPDI